MGVKNPYNTVFTLKFEDPELEGVEVKLRRSFGLLDAGADMAYIDLEAVKAGKTRPQDLQRQRNLVDAFAGALVSWNLEDDDGQPIGTDRETVRGQDIILIAQITGALMSYVNEEAAALIESVGIDEAQLKMEVLP